MWWKLGGVLILSIVLNAGISQYVNGSRSGKAGFVVTQKVFEAFDGTKDIQKKLKIKELEQKATLDSLGMQLKLAEGKNSAKDKIRYAYLKEAYEMKYQQITYAGKSMVENYNKELWTQINEYIKEYGKQHDYTFIHGANGSGTLMYAAESADITEDIIQFVNKKYAGK